MRSKRRQMVLVPEINPHSFVLFFHNGDHTHSWSVRDYSEQNRAAAPRYARDFAFSLDELKSMVVQSIDAPVHPTDDLAFWHKHTRELNLTYLGTQRREAPLPAETSPVISPVAKGPAPAGRFPIIDREQFDRHAKSRKPTDRRRMEESRASEDWVTWTVFRLFERDATKSWWPKFVARAKAENPELTLPRGWETPPQVRLWQSVPAPAAYESASRGRMQRSSKPDWISRSKQPKPVEGSSEIDIILENAALIAFVEAKLGSDISLRTTYDPERNQIVRNIDCLLDQAGDRTPRFWMLVRDAGSDRAYTQLLRHYRNHPEALMAELPHHAPSAVTEVARNLSLVLWSDIALEATEQCPSDDAEIAAIRKELSSRLG